MYIKMSQRQPQFPMLDFGATTTANVKSVWKWGSDNLLPEALMALSRSSTIHRRILNDKANYIAGRGFSYDTENLDLGDFIAKANGQNQSLREIIERVAFDKSLFGNAFLEVVTNQERDFVSLYHQDASRVRLAKDSPHVILHHNWGRFSVDEAVTLPLYPRFEAQGDGTQRSVIHYKDYEPSFEHYGVPKYISAIQAATIAYKTDKWNVSRLENSFQPSGVMVLDGQVDSPEEAQDIAQIAERKFAGKPGQVMFMVKNGIDGDTTKFVPFAQSNDGDWKSLHSQAMGDVIVAHSWFRTLSGIEYSTGFSSDRILYEFDIAMNLIIGSEQRSIMEPLREVLSGLLGVDCGSLDFVNRPPFEGKPPYMYVWEARAEDGLDYDPEDPAQRGFISQI